MDFAVATTMYYLLDIFILFFSFIPINKFVNISSVHISNYILIVLKEKLRRFFYLLNFLTKKNINNIIICIFIYFYIKINHLFILALTKNVDGMW